MTYIESSHTWATGEELTPERLNANNNAVLNGLTDGTKDLNLNQATGELVGNADTVPAMQNFRNINLTGEVIGSTTGFNCTGTKTVTTTQGSTPDFSCTVSSGFRKGMFDLFDDANSNPAIAADATAHAMMNSAIKHYNSGISSSYTDEIVPLNTYLTTNHGYTWSAPQLAIFNDANIAAGIPGNLESSKDIILYDIVKKGAIGVGYEPYYELTFADVSTPVLPATFMSKNIQISFTCFPYNLILPSDVGFVDCLISRSMNNTTPSGEEHKYSLGSIKPNMSIIGFYNTSGIYTTKLQIWFTQKYWHTTDKIFYTNNARRPASFTVRITS